MATPQRDEGAFQPENALERLLQQAARDPGQRPAFYKALLQSELFLLGQMAETADSGEVQLLLWERDGQPWIPLFTSVLRLGEFLEEEERPFLSMEGGQILSMLGSETTAVLNPASAISRELLPREIQALLSGEIFHCPDPTVLPEGQTLRLGLPAENPEVLTSALASYFRGREEVQAAWLALCEIPSSGQPPNLIIGVETERAIQDLLSECNSVIREVMGGTECVDFIQMGEDEISEFLRNETEPFYRRAFWSSTPC